MDAIRGTMNGWQYGYGMEDARPLAGGARERGRMTAGALLVDAEATARVLEGPGHGNVGPAVAAGIHATEIAVAGAEMLGAHVPVWLSAGSPILSAALSAGLPVASAGAVLYEIGHANEAAEAVNVKRGLVRAYAAGVADALAGEPPSPAHGDPRKAEAYQRAYERVMSMSADERQGLSDELNARRGIASTTTPAGYHDANAYAAAFLEAWERQP